MKQMIALTVLLAAATVAQAERQPEWMLPLREAIFEQVLSADQVRPIYLDAVERARDSLSGSERDLAISRAEHLMGRALLFEEREAEAGTHFAEGLRLAEAVVASSPSAQAWLLRGENLAHLIQTKNWTFAMANGLDVEKFAKRALDMDGRNAAARYLIAARWVFAPSPFNNFRRGIQMMEELLAQADVLKDDRFNATSAIGWAYLQQRNFPEAISWLERALEIYPTNRFAGDLMETAKAGRRR